LTSVADADDDDDCDDDDNDLMMVMMTVVLITIVIIIIIIIMDFGLCCTLSADNSPQSVLTKIRSLWTSSMRCHGNCCSISEIIFSCGQVGLRHSFYAFV